MSEVTEAAKAYHQDVECYRAAHFRASDSLRTWHYVVGFGLIVVSAIVSGSVLQASGGNPSHALTLAAGVLSILVVVLTSIQTTFKLGERAELHRSAANGFGKVLNELDVFIHRPHSNVDQAWDELDRIVAEIGSVEAGAPGYLRRTYDKARRQLEDDLAKRRQRGRAVQPQTP
jgi:hypothetical protein